MAPETMLPELDKSSGNQTTTLGSKRSGGASNGQYTTNRPAAQPRGKNQRLAWACRYALQGLAVFPCNGKAPLTEHGYKDATTDLETIGAWWARWPAANIGLPMAPNGLVAIDVDPRNGGTLAALSLPAELRTWRASTGGGGQHVIFAAPSIADLPGALGAGIDVKYHGYVVVAPSVHPETGRRYGWLPGQSPWDLDPAPVPAELLSRMTRQDAPQAAIPGQCDHKPAQHCGEPGTVPLDVVESALRSIDPWAGGYHWWLSLLMALHSEYPDGDGLAVAEAWAGGKPSERGKPSEVAGKWRSFDSAGGVTVGTLLAEAKKHGWKDPRRTARADDETDVPEYWRITAEDWHACPICEPLYVERLSDGSIRSHHKWCRRATCPVYAKVKARRALGPAIGWAGVRFETVPAADWRSFRETARAVLGMHWLGVPQADGSILAVYESADGEPLADVLEVAARAVLAIPKGKKLSRPRRDRTAKPSSETAVIANPEPRPKPVERLAVLDWRGNRRLKDALDALAIPWTRRTHGAWTTEPLQDAQVIGLRSVMAVLRLNRHCSTTDINAQSDPAQPPAQGVFLNRRAARVHALRHDRRRFTFETVTL